MANQIVKRINNISFYAVSGAGDDTFVGIKARGNSIDFYYPYAYNFDFESKELRSQIVSILKTIDLAKTKDNSQANVFIKRDNEADFALDSYLWVIRDYLQNGFYVNREKTFKLNQRGKINWKRTLDTTPIVSTNRQIIYKDIVVESKDNIDNLLVEIHRYCVKKSIDYIGWIFGINSAFIQTKSFNEYVKKQYLSALTKELSNTFEDDKKVRLSHLKNVIQGLDAGLEGKDFIYGVGSYDYVFEKMIDSIFGNEDITKFHPKGQWFLAKNRFRPIDSSNLRPDTIFSNSEDVYVLDSKYYRFGATGEIKHLPETSSIQKQVVYGDFIESNLSSKFKRVYSAFIIPYNKFDNKFGTNSDIFYVGYARMNSNKGKKSHESIHTFLIDLKHVVDTWNNINHSEDREKLITEISNAIEIIND